MQVQKLFPTVVIALQLGAALFYVPAGEWRRVIFWLAAAAMNVVVT